MIKIKQILSITMFFAILITSCKKKPNSEPLPDNKPVPVAHGTVQGAAYEKTIGAEGGIIEMPNSNIKINIPAGAVTTDTKFTVQPVSKTIEGGTGQAFRLGPENVEFKQNIEITFKYTNEDINGAAEDFLYLAFQDSEGYWHRAGKTSLDKQNKTLKIKTRHFSDWVVERACYLAIDAKNTELSEDQTITFKAKYAETEVDPVAGRYEDKLRPIQDIDQKNIEGWNLAGQGTISNHNQPTNTYKAPSKIANDLDEAMVSCSIINLVDKEHPERPGTAGKVITIRTITLISNNEYLKWETSDENGQNGESYQADPATRFIFYTPAAGILSISGLKNDKSISINVHASGTGNYVFGDDKESNKAYMNFSSNSKNYQSTYKNCITGKAEYGSGSVTITSFATTTNFYEGNFSGTLRYQKDCEIETKKVVGSFKIKK